MTKRIAVAVAVLLLFVGCEGYREYPRVPLYCTLYDGETVRYEGPVMQVRFHRITTISYGVRRPCIAVSAGSNLNVAPNATACGVAVKLTCEAKPWL